MKNNKVKLVKKILQLLRYRQVLDLELLSMPIYKEKINQLRKKYGKN